ncbi:MAG: hypothetical protein IJT36_04130 [Alphaproteobacteria bacterium]|nr:hypothetical protein [Alphaproteobacteria bacterium]
MEAIARDALAAFEDGHEDFDAVVRIIDERTEQLGFVRGYNINQSFKWVVSTEDFVQIEDSKKSVVAATSTVNIILDRLYGVLYNSIDRRYPEGFGQNAHSVREGLKRIIDRKYPVATPDEIRSPVVEYFLSEIGEIE